MMNKDYILLIDSQPENLSILDDIDKEFLYKKNLIEISDNVFISKFVGEVITPVNKYFSLPKNFNKDISNIDVIKNLIKKYKELRDDTGKLVLTNNVFSVKNDGDIRSEKVYFNNLKDFFLDYITYDLYIQKKKNHTYRTNSKRW